MAVIFSLFPKETRNFDIEDKCGNFGVGIVHTVENEGVCKMRCRAKCGSIDFEYKKIVFESFINKCNTCKCYCEK